MSERKVKVICFGDSNTFGYDPRSYIGERYSAESRWVDILASKSGWEVRNNGMNGREIPQREAVFSKSTDLLIIMLGTNDLLQGRRVEDVVERMERFLNLLHIERKRIILIAPPPMQRGEWVQEQSLIDASAALAKAYAALAERTGVHFADAGKWNVTIAFDGVHFTEDGNKAFANGLYACLCAIIE